MLKRLISIAPTLSRVRLPRNSVVALEKTSGPYTKLTSSLVAGTTFTDLGVQAGQTYYYVTTAVDYSNNESTYSNQAKAVIPTP